MNCRPPRLPIGLWLWWLSLLTWAQTPTNLVLARQRVWADELEQTDDNARDPTKWVDDLGGNGWGNDANEIANEYIRVYTRALAVPSGVRIKPLPNGP